MSDLEKRYGRRRGPSRRTQVVLSAVGICALVLAVVAVFLLWQSGQPDVRSTLVAYSVETDRLVEARIQVTKPADADAVCDVVAKRSDTAIVGRASVDVTDPSASVTLDLEVETTERAIVVEVDGCRLA